MPITKLQRVILTLWVTLIVFCHPVMAEDDAARTVTSSPQRISNTLIGESKFTNRLAKEDTPFLIDHANNPVDWFPWGDEAFQKAKSENKPIFLSIGYSNSRWNAAMNTESFSNPEIAAIMNENFVNILVDRESMPEVDRVYQRFVRETTGNVGWPLSVWMTPELKPFFGGTYFPAESVGNRPNFPQMLKSVSDLWKNDQDNINANVKEFENLLAKSELGSSSEPAPGIEVLEGAFNAFSNFYDSESGGFGTAPKYPRPVELKFLLHYSALPSTPESNRIKAREMVFNTIRNMAAGGIQDHIIGGFHSQTNDRQWLVPHFEKTIYDQAAIADVCLSAYQITGDDFYKDTAYNTLRYSLRRLAYPQGGFYSAEKAQTRIDWGTEEVSEGYYYLWDIEDFKRAFQPGPRDRGKENVEEILKEELEFAMSYFQVSEDGNVPAELDPNQLFVGKNILRAPIDLDKFLSDWAISKEDFQEKIKNIRARVSLERKRKPQPEPDEKIVTSWNGEMVAVMSRAARVTQNKLFNSSAFGTSKFIEKTLYDDDEEYIFRSYHKLLSETKGSLEDYASTISGLISLYQSGGDINLLKWAVDLQDIQDELFWDEDKGGYFTASNELHKTIILLKEDYDGATPSGVSVSAFNLIKLGRIFNNEEMLEKADIIMRIYKPIFEKKPMAMPNLLSAYTLFISPPTQIVVAGNPESDDQEEVQSLETMLDSVYSVYQPNKVLIHADAGRGQYYMGRRVKAIKAMKAKRGKATAYVCEDFQYKDPITDIEKLTSRLKSP